MREVQLGESFVATEAATLRACLATVLEAPYEAVPEPAIDQGGIGWRTMRWVRCRGMRLCEPCTVLQGYAARPVPRPLVHRGGLRADIVAAGVVRVGDEIRAV